MVAAVDTSETANTASVAALSAAWLSKDDTTFLGMYSDDATMQDFAGDATPHDKKHFVASHAAFRKAVDPTALKDTNVIAVEDFMIDEQKVSITQKAAYSFGKEHIANTKTSETLHSVEVDQ